MIKKNLLWLLLFGATTILSAETITDTTRYYLRVSEYKKEIEFCIRGLQKWNQANATNKDAIVMIKTSLDNDGQLTLFVEQAWKVSIDANMPDYYSYILDVPIFWYMGKSCLTSVDNSFREFILTRFHKYFEVWRKNSPAADSISIKDRISRMSKEEFEKLPFYHGDEEPSPHHGKVVYYPSFVIYTQGGIPKRSEGKTVRVDRLERNILR